MRRTWLIGGGASHPAWLSASRSSSSSWPLLASTTTRRFTRAEQGQEGVDREGPERDGPEEADLEALVPQLSDGTLGQLRRRVARHEEDVGVVAPVEVGPLLLGGHPVVLLVQADVVLLEIDSRRG